MKKIIKGLLFSSTVVAIGAPTVVAIELNSKEAKAWTVDTSNISTNKYAYKRVNGLDLFVANEGTVKVSHNWFVPDKAHWDGKSWSNVVKDKKPYQIPYIAMTTNYWIDYWGINGATFSGGISAGTSGVNASLGGSVSISKSDKSYQETLTTTSSERIKNEYNVSARFSSWIDGSVNVRTLFKLNNSYYVSVDTEVSSINKNIYNSFEGSHFD
ncbi:hypothetical protein [Mycoplasma anserisalpingitidis]|uniref:Uncharacterized protein n=1 Tax=Mycoplasma anserisalpingitidis TaxID=519450 RepID=A0A5B8K1R2_9MOLU|nr:hypothetical protein [Mycoplasma anserisalpingitidis]QDY88590.1 hypothetical protein FOY43_02920 [Mycoplasma anserisalpingitidis]